MEKYVYICITELLSVQQKLTHCKSTILQQNFFKKRTTEKIFKHVPKTIQSLILIGKQYY